MAELTREDVVRKVQKLLALSTSNFEAEAKTAMLKAQKLLAEHNLEMKDCEEGLTQEQIIQVRTTFSAYNAWVRTLASVIADNFKCSTLIARRGNWMRMIFVGFETDAKIAAQVFEYTCKFVDKKGSNLAQTYNDKGRRCTGIKADYTNGFLKGLESEYEVQRTSTEYSLVLAKPKEVSEYMKQFEESKPLPNASRGRGNREAFEKGFEEGKDFAGVKDSITA